MTKFYTKFNKPPAVVSPAGEKSLTNIAAMADTDINLILRRHSIGDSSLIKNLGTFADVSGMQDFAANVEAIRKAKEDFMSLPSTIRDRFGNDPVALVNFLRDSSNDAEALRLGLKVQRKEEPSIAKEIATEIGKIVTPSATPAE